MNVAIAGAGNVGTHLACLSAKTRHRVGAASCDPSH